MIIEDNERGLEAARRSGAHVLKVEGVQDVNAHKFQRDYSSGKTAGARIRYAFKYNSSGCGSQIGDLEPPVELFDELWKDNRRI